jgi:hypothetical protein
MVQPPNEEPEVEDVVPKPPRAVVDEEEGLVAAAGAA